MRVLVVEDNEKLSELLREGLAGEGWAIDVAKDGPTALAYTQASSHDAIVLDLMLPGIDGLGVLARMRNAGNTTPVLVLTARDRVEDRVGGLDAGADDYLTKPFAMDELCARVRALVRRAHAVGTSVLKIADLEIDTVGKVVRRRGRPIDLSGREFAILECLALRRGRVVTRETLRDSVYDGEAEIGSNVIDVYVGHLRRKIDREFEPKLLHTRRGMGYVLEDGR